MIPAERLRGVHRFFQRRDTDEIGEPLLLRAGRRIVPGQRLDKHQNVKLAHVGRDFLPGEGNRLRLGKPARAFQRQRIALVQLGVALAVRQPAKRLLKPDERLRVMPRILEVPAKRLRALSRFLRADNNAVFFCLVGGDDSCRVGPAHQLASQRDIEGAQRRRLVAPLISQRGGVFDPVKLLQRQGIALRRLDLRLGLSCGRAAALRPVKAGAEPGE